MPAVPTPAAVSLAPPASAAGGSIVRQATSRSAGPSVSPTTARSPFVTLQPTGPGGVIPSDAQDGADFYGLGAAVLALVIVVVLARLVVRNQRSPGRQSRGER